MSDETISCVSRRIADHARRHDLQQVHVVLHGGEPLLAGITRLKRIVITLQDALQGVCDLDIRIHTNALLLNKSFCEVFSRYGIKVGVSLDGDEKANDRHRKYANGSSSYRKVMTALNVLNSPQYRDIYAGLLCTVDIENDPVTVYESLISCKPPQIDFLLPHATWDSPPPRPTEAETAYADWLICIFRRWMSDGQPTRIRLFESIKRTAIGGVSLTEAVGLAPSELVVIETDGTYEQTDSLKSAFSGAPATGLDIFHHSLDRVAAHTGIAARQQGISGLCDECNRCPLVRSCGGGLYTHRYKSGNGFINRSVYCADLAKLISHIWADSFPAGHTKALPTFTHRILSTDFDQLAVGYSDAKPLRSLAEAQLSVNRALVARVNSLVRDNTELIASKPVTDAIENAWNVLTEVDKHSRFTVDSVFRHPYLRVWATNCLRLLERTVHPERIGPILRNHSWYLTAIALAVAVRSGTSVRLSVPVHEGAVHIPTMGRLIVGKSVKHASVETAPDTFAVYAETGEWVVKGTFSSALMDDQCGYSEPFSPSAWQPVRLLRARDISVALEDTDPYRDCHQWQATARLGDRQAAIWSKSFARAWKILQEDYGFYAESLQVGLSTIMPLRTKPAGMLSAAVRDAFGAVGVGLPSEAASLALLLIHEFQHVKLGAMLDLFNMYDAADKRLFRVSWRRDARPLEAVLQGAYAHAAVTDYWRVRRRSPVDSSQARATAEFCKYRTATTEALDVLEKSGSLTTLGNRLLDGIRASVSRE